MIQAKIIADSLSPQGHRLTTFEVVLPRFILAEFNTHRMFSRNSASSRAIPFKKMVKMVQKNPFIPIAWQKSHSGMQGNKYHTSQTAIHDKNLEWLQARDLAVIQAEKLHSGEVTKQLCNRILEPFMWHKVIVTSSEKGLENFFKLRCPQYKDHKGFVYKSKKDLLDNVSFLVANDMMNMSTIEWLENNKSQAEIHIQALAEAMWDEYNRNQPKQLKAGEWHLPYGDVFEDKKLYDIFNKMYPVQPSSMNWYEDSVNNLKRKISTARCARLSYQTLGDNPKIDYEADIKLHDRLASMQHWSPFEHVAKAMSNENFAKNNKKSFLNGVERDNKGWCRNFRGFIQYRALIDKQ